MKPYYLLAIALATTAVVAACGEPGDTLSNSRTPSKSGGKKGTTSGSVEEQTGDDDGESGDETPTGPVATNSPEGLAYYKSNVHPFM